MQIKGFVASVLLVLIAGCGDEAPKTTDREPALPPPPPPAAPVGENAGKELAVAAASDADKPSQPAQAENTDEVVSSTPMKAGDGQKSQKIKGSGYYSTVIRSRYQMEEKIHLTNAVHALQLYKAANEGRGPKTHEEYMEKIIKENYIKLPELPKGQRYRYDPETEELLREELVSEP